MTKLFFAVASLPAVSFTVNAQDCDAVKAENARLRFELAKLKGDALMAKADAMLTQTQTENEVNFKLISAIGDRKNQTVTVVISFTNKAANKAGFNTQIRACTSADGEEFTLKSGVIGNSSGEKTLFTDATIRGTYVFAGILPKVSSIKLLPVPHYYMTPSSQGVRGQIEFRDILIT